MRAGSQHCQKGTPALLQRVLARARRLTALPLLLRLDSGNDALDNIATIIAHNEAHPEAAPVHYLIKWNPRQESPTQWLTYAEEHGDWSTPRPGKRVALFEVRDTRFLDGYEYRLRRVMRVIERTIDKHGQHLLIPDIEIEGWWTSLEFDEETIIALYADHATSEQFHSEFKTDLDIERLPSGKFATNALVLACAAFAYNILRWIGQTGLLGSDAPPRHPAKRRRLRTVMQELMYVAARLIATGRRLKLAFGYGCPIVPVFRRLYAPLRSLPPAPRGWLLRRWPRRRLQDQRGRFRLGGYWRPLRCLQGGDDGPQIGAMGRALGEGGHLQAQGRGCRLSRRQGRL